MCVLGFFYSHLWTIVGFDASLHALNTQSVLLSTDRFNAVQFIVSHPVFDSSFLLNSFVYIYMYILFNVEKPTMTMFT